MLSLSKELTYEPIAKLLILGKNGDFGDNFQNRLAGSCRADENIPKRVGEEARQKLPPKGRFYKDQEFCNWLYISAAQASWSD